jgi:hypothetical protein
MNTPLPATSRTPRLVFAGLASLITATLFASVAIGLTGENASALFAQAQVQVVSALALEGA